MHVWKSWVGKKEKTKALLCPFTPSTRAEVFLLLQHAWLHPSSQPQTGEASCENDEAWYLHVKTKSTSFTFSDVMGTQGDRKGNSVSRWIKWNAEIKCPCLPRPSRLWKCTVYLPQSGGRGYHPSHGDPSKRPAPFCTVGGVANWCSNSHVSGSNSKKN